MIIWCILNMEDPAAEGSSQDSFDRCDIYKMLLLPNVFTLNIKLLLKISMNIFCLFVTVLMMVMLV